jgi:hypothetical protein
LQANGKEQHTKLPRQGLKKSSRREKLLNSGWLIYPGLQNWASPSYRNSRISRNSTSKAVKGIFDLLLSDDDNNFMNHVAEIGYNSTVSLKRIVEECDKHNLTFDAGPVHDNGTKVQLLTPNKIKYLVSRLTSTISSSHIETVTGELVVLSNMGSWSDVVEHLKASYPIEMLDLIQKTKSDRLFL